MYPDQVRGFVSSNRENYANFKDIGVKESNADVRILTGSSEVAVYTHALVTSTNFTTAFVECVVA